MAFTEQTTTWRAADLDRELDDFQHMVAAARRNRWHGGDVLGREFDQFLAALPVGRSPERPAPHAGGRNAWREVLNQVD